VNTERLAQRDTIIQQASVPAAGRPRAQQHTVGLHYYGLTAHRINWSLHLHGSQVYTPSMRSGTFPLHMFPQRTFAPFTTIITRSSATAKSTARPSCLVGVLYDISREKICW